MPLESASNIEDLNSSWPLTGDGVNEGDDHLRQEKIVLKNIFPGALGNGFNTPILSTEAELNKLVGLTSSSTQLNYLNIATAGVAEANKALVVDGAINIGNLNVVTANSFVGAVTGDITGDLTGNVTGNVTGDLTGNVTGNVTGNADTATSWIVARNIAVTGDVTGTTSDFDGNANATLDLQLGTDVVGSNEIIANAVGESELKTDATAEGTQVVNSNGLWTVPAGLYLCVSTDVSNGSFGMFVNLNWRVVPMQSTTLVLSDGSNMRFTSDNGGSTTIYWRKLN